jgi:hypothetical protein
VPTWADERAAVFEAIRGLRELCENLADQLADLRWRQLGTQFDSPHAAYAAMKKWEGEERDQAEAPHGSRDDQGQVELPPLRITPELSAAMRLKPDTGSSREDA